MRLLRHGSTGLVTSPRSGGFMIRRNRVRATAAAVVSVLIGAGVQAAVAATGAGSSAPTGAFATEPVVLTGADFPGWTSGPETTARAPEPPTDYEVYDTQGSLPSGARSDCYQSDPKADANGSTDPSHGDHNCFQGSQLPVRTVLKGVPPQSLLGYRWDPKAGRFVQIPFQVDTKWEHYISNNASGFAFYSGTDEMLTYTFDQEPFRYTSNPPFDPADPTTVCAAQPPPGQPTATPDPNRYLTDIDEMAFMARDAGDVAPAGASLPAGIVQANQVRLLDPTSGTIRYVYVMESAMGAGGQPVVTAAYTAANSPYVRYSPDPNAGVLARSQSSYSNYGNAPKGPACTIGPDGQPVPVVGQGFKLVNSAYQLDPATYVQRRTLDIATVRTPRYRFRYGNAETGLAGRWIMDGLQVSANDQGLRNGRYGPSLIDRFKGRAFQQSPGGDTPCCGYEDEQVNWNGSSITMGVRTGPVRTIRVTWGSDSGTNVTRTDIFYADSIQHEYGLRVHPIPPLDGIYTQWNMSAGAVTAYYNPYNPAGVPVTGINPVLYGDTTDFVGPSGVSESSNDKVGRTVGPVQAGSPDKSKCTAVPVAVPEVGSPDSCVYGSFNLPDATYSGLASELLSWEELTGPAGTLVEKWAVDQGANPSAGGAQAAVEAAPYYVDDSCFDDGTGNSPGPQVNPRATDPTTWGFADQGGRPVAVSPAPAPADRYQGRVSDGGVAYDGTLSYNRRCWNHNPDGSPYNLSGTATFDPAKPVQRADPAPDQTFGPQGDVRYFEGDVATHGLHLVFTADSDNADLTTAVDEIDSIDNQLVLPPGVGNVGSTYNEQLVAPIQPVVTAFGPFPLVAPGVDVRGAGLPDTAFTGAAGSGSSGPSPGSATPGDSPVTEAVPEAGKSPALL
jgi:hypothetical protein